MRNLKKFLALVLAFMMAMSLMVTVNASSFADDKDITAAYGESIDVLTELGIVNGYSDGTFLPKAKITRAEVAAILYRIHTTDVDGDNLHLYEGYSEFSDVPATGVWYTPYINYCANNGLIQGVGGGKFEPKENITGYQALVMILRAIGYNNPNEFGASDWKLKASGYGRSLGLTTNVAEGSLGAAATREMVAEIMFKGMLAPTVNYTILNNYQPAKVLIANTAENRAAYKLSIDNGLQLPLCENLLYRNWSIVGKSNRLDSDAFGRPSYVWVYDDATDSTYASDYVEGTKEISDVGDASRYVPNVKDAGGTWGTAGVPVDDISTEDDVAFTLALTPVKTYTDAIDECHLTKDINNDNSIAWSAITEVMNGVTVTKANASTADTSGTADHTTGWLDATHTTTKYIGATGRTTQIYKLNDKVSIDASTGGTGTDKYVNQWIFVYVDTFLGQVTSTTDAIKDTAGHTIKEATATVVVGNGLGKQTMNLPNKGGKYEAGQLVLIQTPNADAGKDTIDYVESPEKAPLYPLDVPNTTAEFTATGAKKAIILAGATKVEGVTVNATVGQQDAKMGIITTDGKTYMASNTFLAARTLPASSGAVLNQTVLADWYDIPNGAGPNDSDTPATLNRGITNNMIGRTFDIVLDSNGYIVGMDEVVSVDSTVGVITGIDSKRIAAGKYVTTVEAFMSDNTTKTFDVVGVASGKGLDDADYDSNLVYWASASDADGGWIVAIDAADGESSSSSGKGSDGGYGKHIGLGSLVEFEQVTMPDGGKYWMIGDWDSTASLKMAAGTRPESNVVSGRDAVENQLVTGRTASLLSAKDATNAARMLDDDSIIFVAEYEYRYNTKPGSNDGANVNKTYKAYKGFKNMPTVTTATDGNIYYQVVGDAVLVYANDAADEYIIRKQPTITVDESYLVLSRGATYATYSEYNVLRNGVETTLKVSNANTVVNQQIENTMDPGHADYNQLILVTGKNNQDLVTSVSTVTKSVANTVIEDNVNSRAADYEIIKKDSTAYNNPATNDNPPIKDYGAGVLRIAGTDASGEFLTVADDCIVKIVNRDLKTCYNSTLAEAMDYANGVDNPTGSVADGLLDSHDLVFELNELGYVCALYVID